MFCEAKRAAGSILARATIVVVAGLLGTGVSMAELQAGVARASITPLEVGLPTQLGGYGEREGKPAEGVHDTINAKAIVFEFDGTRSAIVSLDICTMPRCLVEESIAEAKVPGLTYENVLMCATHTHAGTEGLSMERRNVIGNPHIGIFDERVLLFTRDRVAQCLRDAAAALRPVKAGTAVRRIEGMNRNRRHDGAPTDEDMTILRLDNLDGSPYTVLVNYTAHPTISVPETMLISCDWPGFMQRTIQDVVPGVECIYFNGSEGDVAPRGHTGGSRYEMMENYGRKLGLHAASLINEIKTKAPKHFETRQSIIPLPERQASPDFLKIAGDEYKVDESQLGELLKTFWPASVPLYFFRLDDFGLVSIPGEPITEIGMTAKGYLSEIGVKHPVIMALTGEHIGYILTAEEYAKSGYEVTASFYGPTLGSVILQGVEQLVGKP